MSMAQNSALLPFDTKLPLSYKAIAKALSHIQHGELRLTLPNKQTEIFRGKVPGTKTSITILDWQVFDAFLWRGDVGFGESYINNHWETDDLVSLLTFASENIQALDSFINGKGIQRMILRLAHKLRFNSKRGSKKNIHAHYDLGNDFYSLWLDKTMSYSAALYAGQNKSLEQAQIDKYHRILDKILIKDKISILEIGCGWGGFIEQAIANDEINIHAITISKAQHEFATKRLQKEIEENKVQIDLMDYRDINQQYDAIVSIEMIEAVGEEYWPSYFRTLKESLKNQGKAVIQSIVIDDSRFETYKKSSDFIREHTFPGGMLPSPTILEQQAKKAGLKITDLYSFGLDYAKTLEQWLKNFDLNISKIRKSGYDEQFIKKWRFYMTYCIAGFRSKQIDVLQVELSHA